MKQDPLATLAIQFALLSLVAVGGANTVVPEMHRIAVEANQWMTDREFTDLFALANAAPGPNVLIVSLIGFKIAGITGGLVAILAMCAPSSVLSYFATRLWTRFRDAPWRGLVQRALAPITIGLILASGSVLAMAADASLIGVGVTAGTAALLIGTKFNPLWALALAAGLGLAGIF
jgi:chromate transporter